MRASIVAFGLAGAAAASYAPAPPAYDTPEVYPTVPVYESSIVPVYPTTTPEAKYTTPAVYPPKYETTESKKVEEPKTYPVHTETKVYTAITTYCPEPTVITHGPSTYSVTKATTLTLPPVTVTTYAPEKPEAPKETHPVAPSPPVYETLTTVHAVPTYAPEAPKYPAKNETAPAAPTGAKPSTTKPVVYTGSAAKASAGVLGAFGLFAALFL